MNAFLCATASEEADYTSKVGGSLKVDFGLDKTVKSRLIIYAYCACAKTYNCPFDFLLKFSVIRESGFYTRPNCTTIYCSAKL